MSCIFCKIIDGEIPSKKIYEDEHVMAFHDVNPVAPVHALIIPKKHIGKVSEMDDADEQLMGKLISTAKNVAEQLEISESGFRLVFNNGKSANQTVFHIHLHLLGGRAMTWRPDNCQILNICKSIEIKG